MKHRSIIVAVGLALAAVLPSAPAAAQASRTFVSGHGSDTNPCSLAAPCRSFAYAITQTNAGGEIAVLDTAGYGSVSTTKSISIVAPDGIEAGIAVPSNGNGVAIFANTGDVVTLRGLTITGSGVGSTGILFFTGSTLIVKNCIVRQFQNDGIHIAAAPSSTTVSDTVLSNNTGSGMVLDPTSDASLSFERVELIGNAVGFELTNALNSSALIKASGVDVLATGNSYGFVTSVTGNNPTLGTLMLDNVKALNNSVGVEVDGGTVILSRSAINNGNYGFRITGTGVLKTYGDNRITNAINTGSLTPIGVQ